MSDLVTIAVDRDGTGEDRADWGGGVAATAPSLSRAVMMIDGHCRRTPQRPQYVQAVHVRQAQV
jgi:hypothetical protein